MPNLLEFADRLEQKIKNDFCLIVDLDVLTQLPEPNDQFYSRRTVRGEPLPATRSAINIGDVVIPAGSAPFRVAGGSVQLDEYILWQGQYFFAEGIEPVAPLRLRDIVYTSQRTGAFRLEPLVLSNWSVGGDTWCVDGELWGVF